MILMDFFYVLMPIAGVTIFWPGLIILGVGVGIFATGWLAGILGIGGGLIRMPALIYFIGCGLPILLKMMAKWFPAWGGLFDGSATVLILGLVAAMSLYIGIRMVIGAKEEIAQKKAGIAAAS